MNQLKIIERKNQRVLTSAQLAEAYGTDYKTISNNFTRNKTRYTEGKHFILLVGEERREFLNNHQIDDSSKHAKHIYLWTMKGALLHAKSLGTDKAWEAYEGLVDDYFNKVERLQNMQVPTTVPTTIEGILELAVINMKDIRQELSQVKNENRRLQLVVDNEIWLTENQKAEIQEAVNARVGFLMKKGYEAHFQSIYRALKSHFNVPKYDKIKRSDFDLAIDLIKGWYPKKKEEAN
ncbi:ORF6C domain-containing protein [Paenibacillus polysaccharolyticus]|uniref:ORF6N domain-containing protein n=1 Tax=Paenibacillus polysaccharolyticus TaxID=582692 RepID=UPI00209D1A81|nr:ORF6N domain-containing protein [Paenibacillus polysaccharolyticus]MCP1134378.1 ORF6C domain-containing protein [Paenibacillus polysaccharolyticus]